MVVVSEHGKMVGVELKSRGYKRIGIGSIGLDAMQVEK